MQLSPPFALKDAVANWMDLTVDEITATIEKHFDDCRRFYFVSCCIGYRGDQSGVRVNRLL